MFVKERFPDEESLKITIRDRLPEFTKRLKGTVGYLEDEYRAGFKTILLAIFGIIVIGASLLMWNVAGPVANWFFVALILFVIVLLFRGLGAIKRAVKIVERFERELDQAVFPLVGELFEVKTSLDVLDDSELDRSELITEPKNRVKTDDVCVMHINDRLLRLTELHVQNVTDSGKNSSVKEIFFGYFVSYKLGKQLTGKTFISTEGDKAGFGHQTFWSNLIGDGVETTELEWNDFEQELHVSTTDPVESRTILTPDLMHDLYVWWQVKRQNIRLSFIGDRMYLLFPDKRVRIGRSIPSLSEDQIKGYIESIALPMLHVIHLVEDIKR